MQNTDKQSGLIVCSLLYKGIKIWKYIYVSDKRLFHWIESDKVLIYTNLCSCYYVILVEYLERGSTVVHFTQTNEVRSNTVFEGLETGIPLTTKQTRNRLRKSMASNSRITIAIIVLLCLFVIIYLIYVAFCLPK